MKKIILLISLFFINFSSVFAEIRQFNSDYNNDYILYEESNGLSFNGGPWINDSNITNISIWSNGDMTLVRGWQNTANWSHSLYVFFTGENTARYSVPFDGTCLYKTRKIYGTIFYSKCHNTLRYRIDSSDESFYAVGDPGGTISDWWKGTLEGFTEGVYSTYSFTSGDFSQTSGGFSFSGMTASHSGSIYFEIKDLTNSGSIINTQTFDFDSEFTHNFQFEGPPYIYPGRDYEIVYYFSSTDGEFTSDNSVTPYGFTSPQQIYTQTNPDGSCPENSTLGEIWIIDGLSEVCLYNNNIDTEIITTLSGSTVDVDVNINQEAQNPGFIDSIFQKYFGVDENSLSGSTEGEGLGGEFTYDNVTGTGLENISSSLTGSIGNYGSVIVDDLVKGTCKMFNSDGSFAYYSNGNFDLAVNFTDTGTIWDKILWVPQKFADFITNPLNNVISILRTFGTVDDGSEVCYLGQIQKVEYQKYFSMGNFTGETTVISPLEPYKIEKGSMTYFDYIILLFCGLFLVAIALFVLKP